MCMFVKGNNNIEACFVGADNHQKQPIITFLVCSASGIINENRKPNDRVGSFLSHKSGPVKLNLLVFDRIWNFRWCSYLRSQRVHRH